MGNFWAKVFRSRQVRILMCGLDTAGKTTLLYRMKLGEVVQTIPTIGFNVESIQHRDLKFTAWDVGCRDKKRTLIRHYYQGTDALVVVLDRGDKERMDELYHDILLPLYQEEELKTAVLLFLANKSDLDRTMSLEEVKDKLKLNQLKTRTWNIFPVSAVSGEGILEAMDWLAAELGSAQAKRALTGPIVKDNQKLFYGFAQCSRAFSSLKWLFGQSDNSDVVTESPSAPQAV